jgi:tetratricopeptide (TPR) repeat protein
VRVVAFAIALIVALPAAPARADEASVYQQKATAAYALGEYKGAAEDFEHAFKLHPDPALLYNAAQAHRLGGNKDRALKLYENYLHVYGKKNSRADEVQKHIDEQAGHRARQGRRDIAARRHRIRQRRPQGGATGAPGAPGARTGGTRNAPAGDDTTAARDQRSAPSNDDARARRPADGQDLG